MIQKKLFLLDAMALVYRAYFAFSKSPRYNSKGLNTSAILGFTNTLVEILNKEKPTHIAVAFDTAAPTARHTEFSEYKAHREAVPEDISLSVPHIKRILTAFNIHEVTLDGYEADDIIGTLAKKAEQAGFITYMMTPDKDFGQLVSDNIFIYKPAYMGKGAEILGIPEVLKKFEINKVEQVTDILGLWGDSSDNIPGIPGVGEKTAKQLIAQFASVENLVENASQLKDKLREKIVTHASQALLSKRLATILCDVPVEFNEETLRVEPINKDLLKEIFEELEFRNLAKRILGETEDITKPEQKIQGDLFSNGSGGAEEQVNVSTASNLKNICTVPHQYHIINTKEEREKLISILSQQKSFCFDTETTSIDPNNAELVGLSISFKLHEAYYIPFPKNQEEAKSIIDEFKNLFENETIQKVGQNLKFDITVLKWYGIRVLGKLFDTMLAHYLIEPDMRHNMNILAESYLNYSPIPIENLIGERSNTQINMREVPLETIAEYACEDADITLQLKELFEPLLKKQNVLKLFEEVEIPLIHVLVSMETEGVSLDKNTLGEFSKNLESDIIKIEKQIYELAGINFNIASPKQLGDILFDVLKIDPKAKRTKTGQYATGEDILSKMAERHPIITQILEYRELQKLKNTYVDTLPLMINVKTGRVHTSFNQTVAATGRLSSNNPNLQNIPIRTAKGREVRKAFISKDENCIILSADYSQIELRIVAEFSKDPSMIEAFLSRQDIHTATAAKVYNINMEEVTSEMRRKAKMVNFGIIYGISAFGLAQRLNIPKKEAAFIIEQYFLKYPLVKKYMDDTINIARERGYVETILGRRRYLKDINSQNAVVRGFAERNAINAPIQGSAADMIKVAMINILKTLNEKGLKSRMTLQVHDELVFDVPKEEIEIVKPIIEHCMKTAIPMSVPLEVEIGVGVNWIEAH